MRTESNNTKQRQKAAKWRTQYRRRNFITSDAIFIRIYIELYCAFFVLECKDDRFRWANAQTKQFLLTKEQHDKHDELRKNVSANTVRFTCNSLRQSYELYGISIFLHGKSLSVLIAILGGFLSHLSPHDVTACVTVSQIFSSFH